MLHKEPPTKEQIAEWFKKEPVESVDVFIANLDTLDHDYSTVVEAMAAVAIQACRKFNQSERNGGITGFQANGVMWTFIQRWLHEEGPMKLVKFDNMLYPQYVDDFQKTISQDTWEHLRKEAASRLGSTAGASTEVKAHWISIASGTVPFGYTVRPE